MAQRVSNPSMKAVSAARAQPAPEPASGPLSKRLKAGAEDTALNVLSILRDVGEDFRKSDRFFKYKAFVLAGWIALSGASIVVACPGSGGPHNTLGARLVQTKVVDTPVMMIVNDSGRAWTDVTVIVNNEYRASVGKVAAEAPDNNLTLEPRKLLGEGGKMAPNTLQLRDIVVRTRQGEADLLVNGAPP
jgi:hypothetical protein